MGRACSKEQKQRLKRRTKYGTCYTISNLLAFGFERNILPVDDYYHSLAI